ncbi:GNAT family N-acetyltransferase [Jannaschia rubra]|uniref:Ribosomal-protein-alanine acetyltransferase n=1 Tax=Jannaschia rubra TaxID=282197 RepID=A0A0M6XRK4_9RHOB|nr:GNAT family N-acetyltransferase [Jannaschia rubra]CTQ33478.1 ribosomal-protein-alanine acetyltransferase [Jannaschia rubra]SFG02482.1 Acetyltransferase (GNAT) domain-containing protein [Jannaschia rubra]
MIRRATPADRQAIRDLHLASWRDSYGAELPADYMADGLARDMDAKWAARSFDRPELTLVAYTDTELTGFACAILDRDPPLIDNLHIRPELRGGGTGGKLLLAMKVALRQAGFDRAYLTVLESNPRARAFYLSHGGIDEGPVEDVMVGRRVRARRIGFDLQTRDGMG